MTHPGADDLDDTVELTRRARQGGDREFTALYARTAPALYAWLRLKIRPTMSARLDPEDVMQDVWVRAVKAFRQYDVARGSFRGWLFQVSKFALLDALRGLGPTDGPRVVMPGGASEGGFAPSQVPAEVTTISRRAMRAEGMRAFVERLQALPQDDQRLVVHRGIEDLSRAETARQLGLSTDAVEKRWQRLRQRLVREGVPEGVLD